MTKSPTRTRTTKRRSKRSRWKAPAIEKAVCVKVRRNGRRTRAAGTVSGLDTKDGVLVGVYYRVSNMNEHYALASDVTVDRAAEKRRQAKLEEAAREARGRARKKR
jgi:hypothetical protein